MFLSSHHFGGKKAMQNFRMRIKISDKWVNYLYGPIQIKQQVG